MNIFHPDIFENVQQYLSLREISKLAQCNYINKHDIKRYFHKALQTRLLDNIGLNVSDFKRILRTHGAILSGSAMMHVCGDMSEDMFAHSDIDIFCHTSRMKSLCDDIRTTITDNWLSSEPPHDMVFPLIEHPYFDTLDSDYNDPTNLDEEDNPVHDEHEEEIENEIEANGNNDMGNLGQYHIKNFWYNSRKIQVIAKDFGEVIWNKQEFHRQLVDEFDLQLCASYYDGTKVILSHQFITKGEMIPLDKIIKNRYKIMRRIAKYMNRGYTFLVCNELTPEEKNIRMLDVRTIPSTAILEEMKKKIGVLESISIELMKSIKKINGITHSKVFYLLFFASIFRHKIIYEKLYSVYRRHMSDSENLSTGVEVKYKSDISDFHSKLNYEVKLLLETNPDGTLINAGRRRRYPIEHRIPVYSEKYRYQRSTFFKSIATWRDQFCDTDRAISFKKEYSSSQYNDVLRVFRYLQDMYVKVDIM